MLAFVLDVLSECGLRFTGHVVLSLVPGLKWDAAKDSDGVAACAGFLFWVVAAAGFWLAFLR